MSALDQMRATLREAKPKKGSKKVWHQPEVDDFAPGFVLAFDQTLTKTGWVCIVNSQYPDIVGAGVIFAKVDPSLTGFEETFAKAASMELGIRSVMGRYRNAKTVLHEMPSVSGHRIESSYMAAREVRRCQADLMPMASLFMINRQSAYATMTGKRHAEKAEMTECVNRLIPPSRRENVERWNQDVHDSCGIALKHLYDRKAKVDAEDA